MQTRQHCSRSYGVKFFKQGGERGRTVLKADILSRSRYKYTLFHIYKTFQVLKKNENTYLICLGKVMKWQLSETFLGGDISLQNLKIGHNNRSVTPVLTLAWLNIFHYYSDWLRLKRPACLIG